MEINYKDIGRRIAEERRNHHLSQESLAADLGLHQADISNLEHANKGSGIQDLSKLSVIASYFSIPVEELLFGETERDTEGHYQPPVEETETDLCFDARENAVKDDPLYLDVEKYVFATGKASSSLLQREFGIGYNRAIRMIDVLEQNGIIGKAHGSRPREVLI